MNVLSAKTKVACIADKISNSKLYKTVEKGAVTASAFLATAGVSAVNAFAEEMLPLPDRDYISIRSSFNLDEFLSTANPYIKAAIGVLCIVGGFKLGIRIFRGSFH